MKSSQVFIIDTNVLVAGLITGDKTSPTARIVNAMVAGKLLYLLSPALLKEYRIVLLRPRLIRAHRLGEHKVDHLLTEITANAVWREPSASGTPSPDPNDDFLWDLLAAEPEAVLVTGGQLLQDQPPAHRQVIAPTAMVEQGWL